MPAGILFTKRNENRARSQVSCIVTYFIECFCFVHLANHIVQVCIDDFSFSCNNSLKGYTTVNGYSLLQYILKDVLGEEREYCCYGLQFGILLHIGVL